MSAFKFEIINDIPHYYSCNFPQYFQKLKARGGATTLSLLSNCRFFGVPAYVIYDDPSIVPNLMWWSNNLPYEKYLYETRKKHFDEYLEGIDYIRKEIDQVGFAIVSVSPYYLPYHYNYQDSRFIRDLKRNGTLESDHWIGIYGVDDKNLQVYDPLPEEYAGEISIQDFEQAWRGSSTIPELASINKTQHIAQCCVVDTMPVGSLSKEDLPLHLKTVLKTECHEFLASPVIKTNNSTYYYGIGGREKIISKIEEGFNNNSAGLGRIKEPMFNIRWPYMYFLNLIEDCEKHCEESYKEFVSEGQRISEKWEKLSKNFVLKAILRKIASTSQQQKFIDEAKALVQEEKQFFEKLYGALSDVPMMQKLPEHN